MPQRGHETLEHTADMGIRGWGPSIKDAFEEIARAMFELMVVTDELKPSRRGIEISCEGGEPEELLVEFLNKLILHADIEDIVFLDVSVERLDEKESGWTVEAVASGVPRSEVGDLFLTEVKAATYYGASVAEKDAGTWVAQCVVDL